MDALVPDIPREAIEPLLPPEPVKPKGGRPPSVDRAALAGIILLLRTGMPWKFANGANFRGFSFVPVPETTFH